MSDKLPQRIDPFRAADQGRVLQGVVPVRQMSRLLEVVVEKDQDLSAKFAFMRDSAGVPFVRLTCRSRLVLRCERCLGPVGYDLDLQLKLALLDSQAVEPDQVGEVVEVHEEGLFLRDLLEDEILLALPLISRHASLAECDQENIHWLAGAGEEIVYEKKANPFDILRKLKD